MLFRGVFENRTYKHMCVVSDSDDNRHACVHAVVIQVVGVLGGILVGVVFHFGTHMLPVWCGTLENGVRDGAASVSDIDDI